LLTIDSYKKNELNLLDQELDDFKGGKGRNITDQRRDNKYQRNEQHSSLYVARDDLSLDAIITMSTGKRLAKRSILGTRVVAPGDDGRLYPGIIAAMKTPEGGSSSTSSSSNHPRYAVRFDENRKIKEFYEREIIGPGFSAVTSSKLRPKQKVWVTNANREMEGCVLHHRPNIDQVIIQLNGGPEVKKKLEEVRLMESRKSARLIGHGNTDFSKLADFNIVHERKRINSETSDISSGTTR